MDYEKDLEEIVKEINTKLKELSDKLSGNVDDFKIILDENRWTSCRPDNFKIYRGKNYKITVNIITNIGGDEE